jgi:SulP family sulfate permease
MLMLAGDLVAQIPMAALVAVMIMVSIGTLNWQSLRELRTNPRSSSVVMLATVAVTVSTHDLAMGVLTGVLLSGFFFAHKVGQVLIIRSRTEDEGRARHYDIIGQVFFASADRFVASFDFREVIEKVVIDVSRANFWDITAVSALDKVVIKFRREGTAVEVLGMNEASRTLVDKFAVHDKDGAEDLLLGH